MRSTWSKTVEVERGTTQAKTTVAVEESEALARFIFHLEHETGFWFSLVACDEEEARTRLLVAVDGWCSERGQDLILHEPKPFDLRPIAIDLARGGHGLHWIRTGGPEGSAEQWGSSVSQLFLAMNERREAYRRRLDGGLVVDGPQALKRMLRELAPDMFSIRAFIADMVP